MTAPESRNRAIAVPVIVSFLFLLAAQALPQAARCEQKKARAAAAARVPAPGFKEQAEPSARVARRSSRLLPSLLGLAVAGVVAAVLVLTVFKKSGYDPHIIPQEFVAGISNPYFPHPAGQVMNYMVSWIENSSALSVTSTVNSKMIMGVLCLGVHDRGRGIIAEGQTEDTWRWYAQDRDGNVWIFAQETKKYDYAVLTEDWSWQAGTNGAKPGKVMPGRPLDYVNKEFQLEFVPGIAEDKAMVLGVNEKVTVPFGTFSGCVKIKVFSDLEPGKESIMYFAPGTGLVLRSEGFPKGGRRQELVGISNE
jgi:hypothetical protein